MPRLRSLPPLAKLLAPFVPIAPKETDQHLGTAAHKDWSRKVKERAGYRCEDPEHASSTPRSGPGVVLYADHIQERQDAPHLALDLNNGMCRCAPCHVRKTHQARAQRLAR